MKRKLGKPSTYGDGPIYNLKTFVNLKLSSTIIFPQYLKPLNDNGYVKLKNTERMKKCTLKDSL